MKYKKVIGLDENGYKVTLELEIKETEKEVKDFETLNTLPIGQKLLTISGFAQYRPHQDYSYCGQIDDTIKDNWKSYKKRFIKTSKLNRIIEIWKRYHLNDLKAGTKKQLDMVKVIRKDLNLKGWQYDTEVKMLEKTGLLIDNGYKYGSGWLYETIPQSIINEIISLFCKVNYVK